jgi:hypothetical protein
MVGFSAAASSVKKTGTVSFAPGTRTYWETVATDAPAAAPSGLPAGFSRRALAQASSTDAGAYNAAVQQQEQLIQAANAQASQDAAQAAHDQYVAENMQQQQAKAEANAEALQAQMLVQSQTLNALTAPTPAPAPAPSSSDSSAPAAAPASGASSDLKAHEAKASLEGGVASMAN